MSDFQKHLAEELRDINFSVKYYAREVHYEFAKQIINRRLELGLIQKELAEWVGTSQGNISRLEHGTLNPSFELADRIAMALGKKLKITME